MKVYAVLTTSNKILGIFRNTDGAMALIYTLVEQDMAYHAGSIMVSALKKKAEPWIRQWTIIAGKNELKSYYLMEYEVQGA